MQTEVKVLSVFLVPYTIPPFGTVIPDWAARSTDELSIVYRLDNNTIKLHHRVPIAEKQRAAAMVKKMNAVLAAKQATTAPPQQPVPWQRSPSAAEFAQIAAQQEAERIKQETLQKQKEEEEQKQHVAAIQQHHDWLVRRAYNEFNDWCEENGSYWMAQKYQQSGKARLEAVQYAAEVTVAICEWGRAGIMRTPGRTGGMFLNEKVNRWQHFWPGPAKGQIEMCLLLTKMQVARSLNSKPSWILRSYCWMLAKGCCWTPPKIVEFVKLCGGQPSNASIRLDTSFENQSHHQSSSLVLSVPCYKFDSHNLDKDAFSIGSGTHPIMEGFQSILKWSQDLQQRGSDIPTSLETRY